MSPKNPLRDLTPTEADLDDNTATYSSSGNGETLREKAAKKLHGPNANPSQLGDPISLKAESSEANPKPEEAGAQGSNHSSTVVPSSSREKTNTLSRHASGETLREKATKALKGPNANPSQLGDPISLKAETTEHGAPEPSEEGPRKGGKRQSRL